ncbi:hypothetical protein [Actinomycetospora sp. CA-053990]|uniref:hypothetical protein n=1 Tax=Actinomycetospora sp. CA-053990 TaxID=3239891 RepID=UPI003D8B7568
MGHGGAGAGRGPQDGPQARPTVLGGRDAVANPLGFPITGPTAKLAARGYHLLALPGVANRVRLAADWLLDAVLPPQSVRLSGIRPEDAVIATAQSTDIYPVLRPADDGRRGRRDQSPS